MKDDSVVALSVRRETVLRAVFLVCIAMEVSLFLLDYHVNYGRAVDLVPIRNLFNTTREDALASWFSVTQTILVALTLWLIFLVARAKGKSRMNRLGWGVLAVFFTYMAIDDGAELHERIGSAMELAARGNELVDSQSWAHPLLAAFPSYTWQILFVPIFAVIGLFMVVFFWRTVEQRGQRLLLVMGLVCFAMAIALDFVEGLDEYHPWNLYAWFADLPGVESHAMERFNRDGFEATRHFGKSLEEVIEMLGTTLLWLVFLRQLMHNEEGIVIRWQGS